MGKLLSFAIPCYNSAEYMEHCINTVLAGGDEVEVIIVDDGSTKDNTYEIAKRYEKEYPDIVKAVHQENGGHGEAVNTGLKHATGRFFKVVDSDDWVDGKSYKRMLATLRSFEEGSEPDMVIANYVYEKVGAKRKKVIHYENVFPVEQMFTWDDINIGDFKVDQYILMHTVVYRTQLLKDCGLELPKHTFYVDNLYAYIPLPYVNTIFYLDVDLYRYFIGREDQSVNEAIMIKRIDQQLKVTKLMIDSHDLSSIKNRKLQSYMTKYLAMMMIVSSALLVKDGTPESLRKRQELWDYLKSNSKRVYRDITNKKFGRPLQLKSKVGRQVIILGYRFCNKIYGFN